MWLYNTYPRAGENLTVSFQNNASTTVTVSQFNIMLNFKVRGNIAKQLLNSCDQIQFAIVQQIAFVYLDDAYEHALKCSRCFFY